MDRRRFLSYEEVHAHKDGPYILHDLGIRQDEEIYRSASRDGFIVTEEVYDLYKFYLWREDNPTIGPEHLIDSNKYIRQHAQEHYNEHNE